MKQKHPSNPPAMDPTIWTRLPEEILELILSFLPLKTFLNLRSTCRRFNSLVFSPPFVSKHLSSPFPPLLLLSHPQLHGRFALHDSSLATWRFLPLPSSSSLLSASNGLLCFSHQNSSSFLLCNVLSNSSRLVRFPFHPFPFDSLSLAAAGRGGSYSVLALSPPRAFLYDSATLSWSRTDPPDPVSAGSSHDRGVVLDGRLCFATPEPFSVVWIDLESREWGRSRAAMPGEVNFVRLVSAGGDEDEEGGGGAGARLLMVGGVGRNGISRSLRVWELRVAVGGGGSEWVEVSRVPEAMCQKFMSVCYHNYQHVYCFWHRGTVCVCCYTWPEILYLRLSTGTWHWVPKCPSLPDKWSCGFTWFSFLPHLYAMV